MRRAGCLEKHSLLILQVDRLPPVPVGPGRDVPLDDESVVDDGAVEWLRAAGPRPQSRGFVRGARPQRREHDRCASFARADVLRGNFGHDEEVHRRPHVLHHMRRLVTVNRRQVHIFWTLHPELVVVILR